MADESADREDAAKPREQAFLLEGAIHDVAQPFCRDEQGENESVLECFVRGWRFLRVARGET